MHHSNRGPLYTERQATLTGYAELSPDTCHTAVDTVNHPTAKFTRDSRTSTFTRFALPGTPLRGISKISRVFSRQFSYVFPDSYVSLGHFPGVSWLFSRYFQGFSVVLYLRTAAPPLKEGSGTERPEQTIRWPHPP